MDKEDKLSWFLEIMKTKMLRHEKEEPSNLSLQELFKWLEEEIHELKIALSEGSRESIIKECADIANLAYFIARKIIKEWPR